MSAVARVCRPVVFAGFLLSAAMGAGQGGLAGEFNDAEGLTGATIARPGDASEPARPAAATSLFDESWRWAIFTSEDGLPSNWIEHVIETEQGTPWVATTLGLAWYDGFWWNEVRLEPDTTGQPAPSHLNVQSLRPGRGDEVFAVIDYTLYVGDQAGLRPMGLAWNDQPLRICMVGPIDGSREFLVQDCTGGLRVRVYHYREGKLSPVSLPHREPGESPPRLLTTGPGRIWLNAERCLYRWTGSDWEPFFKPPSGHCNVLKFAENDSGAALLQLADLQSNMTTWAWAGGSPPREITSQVGEYIQALEMHDAGDVIAAFHSGSIRVGRPDGLWRDVPGPRAPRSANALWWSRSGNVWVASENGLLLFRATPQRWQNWRLPGPEQCNRVHAVLPRQDGTIWLGTADGLVILDADQRATTIRQLDGQDLGLITALAEDGEGHVWVGSGANFSGAWRFDGATWRHFGEADGLIAPRVHQICIGRDGSPWLMAVHVTFRQPVHDDPGVFVFRSGRFEQLRRPDGSAMGRVYDAFEGPDGSIWLATAAGLERRKGNQWRRWTVADGLRIDRVYTVAVTPEGRAWFGHESQDGLGYIGVNDNVRYVEHINGLDRHFVSDLDVTADGSLWVAKAGAVCRYRDGAWSTFGLAEGLPATQAWAIAITRDELLVGLLGAGLSRLKLADVASPAPEVRIAQPVVDHQVALIRWRAQSRWAQVNSANIETRYQLDDLPWSSWSRVREATLTRLSPGPHVFRVQTHEFIGDHLPATRDVRFTVDGPFYGRAEFLGPLAGLSGLSLAAIAIQGRRRRRHQRDLRQSEEKFRQLAENIGDVFWLRDCAADQILYVSPAYEKTWGLSRQSLYEDSMSWTRHIHPDDRERAIAAFADRQRPADQAVEYRLVLTDGRTRWILDRGFPIRDERGRVVRVAGIAEDITARKEAELAQRRSTRQLQSILDNTSAVMYIKDLSGRYLLVNSRYEELFDLKREGVVGRTDYEIFPTEFADRFRANDIAAAQAGGPITIEERALHQDGVHDYVSVKFPLTDEDGLTYAVCGISTDISVLKRTEETLRRHAIVFDTIADALLMIDLDRRITDVNTAGERMFGYARAELIGQPIGTLLRPEEASTLMPRIRSALDTQHRWNGEVWHVHKDGHGVLGDVSLVAVLDQNGQRIGSIGVVRDVTEKRLAEETKARLEAQLRHVQRVETVGRLTTNMAHNFSNLLTGILLHTDMARQALDEDHAARHLIEMIEAAAIQARGDTGMLLGFVHKAITERKPVDLGRALVPTLKLLEHYLAPLVRVNASLPPDGQAWTLADETQLQQALMNLGINARDAMPDGGTLDVTVTTGDGSNGDGATGDAESESAGLGEITLSVRDNGPGMSPEVLKRAFETFFTTKPPGKGTGLGLSIVKSIVHSHRGRIRIESDQGRGTSVYITLPRCAPPERRTMQPMRPRRKPRAGGWVMVVEDDDFVRSIMVSAIRAAGYEVIAAADGDEAIRLLQPSFGTLRGAVVDLELPKRGGDSVIEDLRAVHPGLPVIRMTGLPPGAEASPHNGWILRKPFKMAEFMELLNRAIG